MMGLEGGAVVVVGRGLQQGRRNTHTCHTCAVKFKLSALVRAPESVRPSVRSKKPAVIVLAASDKSRAANLNSPAAGMQIAIAAKAH